MSIGRLCAALILPMSAILLYGCADSGFKQSALVTEFNSLQKRLQAPAKADTTRMALQLDNRIFVAGYPLADLTVEGRDYTVFALARPTYSEGGSQQSSYRNPSTGLKTVLINRITPQVNIEQGKARFALEGKIPIWKRNWWIFWSRPALYFFPVEITPASVPFGKSNIRVLRWTNRTPSWGSSLQPPALPDHLKDLRASALFVAQESYTFYEPGVRFPLSFHLELDQWATKKLYSMLMEGDSAGINYWDKPKIERMIHWLDAYPCFMDAVEYHANRRHPIFMTRDKENIAAIKREQKAHELLEKSIERDSLWQEPRELLEDVEDSLSGTNPLDMEPADMGQRIRFGIGGKAFYYDNYAYYEPAALPKGFYAFAASIFGMYQASQNISIAAGLEPFTVRSPTPEGRQLGFVQPFLCVNYQTPLRVQLGEFGSRLQLSCGVIRLSDSFERDHHTYEGSGVAFDVGLSLVPRRHFRFKGPESDGINRSGWLELGYRGGSIDKFTTEINGREVVLTDDFNRQQSFKPNGFWLALNVDLLGF
jgi:hypothetical protein